MMKFVYVLVSTGNDIYYEQFIISSCSLQKYDPGAEIIVFVDDATFSTLKGKRSLIFSIANVKVINFADNVSSRVRSRLLKTSLRKRVNGKFVFLDTDTVVCEKLEWPEKVQDVGMVLDRHLPFSGFIDKTFHQNNANELSFSTNYNDMHFNTGVIFVSESTNAYEFYDNWEKLYKFSIKKGVFTDQASANEVNCRMNGIITEIDGTWNVQPEFGAKYISGAKVIHYAGYRPNDALYGIKYSIPYKLCDVKFFLDIKNQGKPSPEVELILNNPRAAFKNSYIIPDDCSAYYLISSDSFRFLRYLYVKKKWFYKIIEWIIGQGSRFVGLKGH